MKILAIGDSLALPGHGNSYEDTWIYKLKLTFPSDDFITFFQRQLTTKCLVEMGGGDGNPKGADMLEFYKPGLVLLQLGIVDCAPRFNFKRWERFLLNYLPSRSAKSFLGFLKVRGRDNNNTRVSVENFESNLIDYCDRAQVLGTKVILISISIPDERMIVKNPNIIENVFRYNNILKSLSRYNNVFVTTALDPLLYDFRIYDEDGYHLNKVGHQLIYNYVTEFL